MNNENKKNKSKIYLITGGTRSGKSKFAEYIGKKYENLSYIALSKTNVDDKNWQKRIKIHKKRRPNNWSLIETEDLLNVLANEKNNLLIDSLGGFVMKNLNINDKKWLTKLKDLIYKLKTFEKDIIIVGEHTGWGLVSEYKIGNLFIDRMGNIISEITKISDENWLTINGKAIRLDKIFIDIPN